MRPYVPAVVALLMGQVLSPMGAHSVSDGTAPVITECHPGRPWRIERTFHLHIVIINYEENNSQYDPGTAFTKPIASFQTLLLVS